MYFKSPVTKISGDIEATITAQLGVGATGGDWMVDVYNRATDQWNPMSAENTLADGKP